MRAAPESLVRIGILQSTRDRIRAIRRITRERVWELIDRLIEAEHRRLHQAE